MIITVVTGQAVKHVASKLYNHNLCTQLVSHDQTLYAGQLLTRVSREEESIYDIVKTLHH